MTSTLSSKPKALFSLVTLLALQLQTLAVCGAKLSLRPARASQLLTKVLGLSPKAISKTDQVAHQQKTVIRNSISELDTMLKGAIAEFSDRATLDAGAKFYLKNLYDRIVELYGKLAKLDGGVSAKAFFQQEYQSADRIANVVLKRVLLEILEDNLLK